MIYSSWRHEVPQLGDEGNLHLPQSLGAHAEVRELMNVKQCIMNAQKNKPIIGAVYDSLSAAFRLTVDGVLVDVDTYNDCLSILTENGMDIDSELPIPQLSVEQRRYIKEHSILTQRFFDSLSNIPGISQASSSFETRLREHGADTYIFQYTDEKGVELEAHPDNVRLESYYSTNPGVEEESDIRYYDDDVTESLYHVVRTTVWNPETQRDVIEKQYYSITEQDRNQMIREAKAEQRRKFNEANEERALKLEQQGIFFDKKGKSMPPLVLPTFETFIVLKDNPDVQVYHKSRLYLVREEDDGTGKMHEVDDVNTEVKVLRRITGKALFSTVLPEDFYYNHEEALIIHGILIKGQITKKHIGSEHGSIIQALYKDYGVDVVADFITNITWILTRWEQDSPLSMGYADCDPQNEAYTKQIKNLFTESIMKIEASGVEPLVNPLEERQRELNNIDYADVIKNFAGNFPKEFKNPKNNLNTTTGSGAKGSTLNYVQMTGGVGQQYITIKGHMERMPTTITAGTRAIPHFPELALDPRARGMIMSSFTAGLTMAEAFFHSTGSREGLLDTATKTAESGAIHRRLLKALENTKTAHNGSVVDSNNTIT